MKLLSFVTFIAIGVACAHGWIQNWGNTTGPFIRREVRADAVPNQVVTRWVQHNSVIDLMIFCVLANSLHNFILILF